MPSIDGREVARRGPRPTPSSRSGPRGGAIASCQSRAGGGASAHRARGRIGTAATHAGPASNVCACSQAEKAEAAWHSHPESEAKDGRESMQYERLVIQKTAKARPTPHSPQKWGNVIMEPLSEALRLLRRPPELEGAMRQRGGIRVAEECEIYALREQLKH